VLGVQCGKGEMVREYCGADEAIQDAYPVTQMEASKPCQRRPGNGLGATAAPRTRDLSGTSGWRTMTSTSPGGPQWGYGEFQAMVLRYCAREIHRDHTGNSFCANVTDTCHI
jgi:hypothetical protein